MTTMDMMLKKLRSYPPKVHRLRPACPPDRIQETQAQLGTMPEVLVELLTRFNGGELFFKAGPFITIFGISMIPPMSPLQWAPDWYVDKFTPVWRNGVSDRQNDWAIAMKNYGGLIVLDNDGEVREWDTSEKKWNNESQDFDDWIASLLRDGDAFLHEM